MAKPTSPGPVLQGADLERSAVSRTYAEEKHAQPVINETPFIGRIGGNGAAYMSRTASSQGLIEHLPDATPLMSYREAVNLRPFLTSTLWKAAVTEGVGTMLLVWVTTYASLSPNTLPDGPTARFGNFDNAAFIGPLVGGLLNFLFLTLFTFCFGGVSGAHLNPTITIATLMARLCSLPRAVLYIAFQTAGGALGGLMVRTSYGSRDFKVGGCWLFDDVVPIQDAFAIEFMATTLLLFFAFGVGLDPRQKQSVGPTLGPFLVGLSLGSLSFGTGYSRFGYGGASINPARCFGAFVGSSFPGWHWIHWVADITACVAHTVLYHLVPPWKL